MLATWGINTFYSIKTNCHKSKQFLLHSVNVINLKTTIVKNIWHNSYYVHILHGVQCMNIYKIYMHTKQITAAWTILHKILNCLAAAANAVSMPYLIAKKASRWVLLQHLLCADGTCWLPLWSWCLKREYLFHILFVNNAPIISRYPTLSQLKTNKKNV